MRVIFQTFLLFIFNFAQAQSTPLLNEPNLPRFETTLTIPQGMRPKHPIANREFPMALADSFQMALEVLRDSLDSKGLSATVLANNGDSWSGAAGISHLNTPMTTDMYLGMGSLSKSITAACLLKLQEEGLVDLDDPISSYLPSYPNISGIITIRQLLNHKSGVFDVLEHPSVLDSMQANFSRIWAPDEVLNTFVNTAYFAPGTNWKYSNTNYILAGLIIEKVTNLSFHEAVKTKILEPIGLQDLFLNPYETTSGDIAHVWIFNSAFQTKVDLDALNVTPISIYSTAWAAGAYFSRPAQVAKWLNALLTGQVLSAPSLTQMQGFVEAGDNEYGLGLMKISNGTQSFIGHQGYILYSSLGFYDPITQLTIVIQSNDATSTDLSAFLAKAYTMYYNEVVSNQNLSYTDGVAYPNPALHQIQLMLPTNFNTQYKIQLTDILGRPLSVKVLAQNDQQVSLDISALSSGLFFAEIINGKEIITYKFAVK